MRVLVRILVLMAVLLGTLVGSATAKRHGPLVLHPKWHRVAGSKNVEVLTSGRYAYIGGSGAVGSGTGSGVLIDELTGKRVNVAIPAGCFLDSNSSPIGGSWLVATCNVGQPAAPYELYSIPAGTWTPFTPNVKQMFAFNADCKTGDPQCGASVAAIANQWIEFLVTCGYHCGPTTFAFQNLQTGQVDDQPPDWKPGGTEIPNLNSPILTQHLCKPLKVPDGFTDPTTNQTLPGTISFYGRFVVAQQWSPGNLNIHTYLARCGSGLHKLIDPNDWPLAGNAHAIIWTLGFANPTPGRSPQALPVQGLFLPTLRRFTITTPSAASVVALSAKHIYAATPGPHGGVYEAQAPSR